MSLGVAEAKAEFHPSEFVISSHLKPKDSSFPDNESKQASKQIHESREFSFAGGNVAANKVSVPSKGPHIFVRPVLPAQILYENEEPESVQLPIQVIGRKEQTQVPSLVNSNLWYSGTLPSSNFLTPALLSPTGAAFTAGREGKQMLSTKTPVSVSDNQPPYDLKQGGGSLISSFEKSKTHLQQPLVPNHKQKKDGPVFQVANTTGIEYMVGPQKQQNSGYGDLLAAGTFGSGSSPARYTPANSQRLEFNLTPSGKESSSPVLVLNPRPLTMVKLDRITIMGQPKPKCAHTLDCELSSTRIKDKGPKIPSVHHDQPDPRISEKQRAIFHASQTVNASTPQLGLSRASNKIESAQAKPESEDEDIDLRQVMSIVPNSPDKRSSHSAYFKPNTANELVVPNEDLGYQNFSEAPSSIEFEEPFARKSSAPPIFSHQGGVPKAAYLRQQTTPNQPVKPLENLLQFGGQSNQMQISDGSTLLSKDTQQIGLFRKKKGFQQIPGVTAEKMTPEPQKPSPSPGKSAKTYMELRKSQSDLKSYTPISYKQELKPLQSIIKPRDQPESQTLKLTPVQLPHTAPVEPIRPRQDTTPTVVQEIPQLRTNPALAIAPKLAEASANRGIAVSLEAVSKLDPKDRHPRSKPPASPNLKVTAKVNSFRKRDEQAVKSSHPRVNTSGDNSQIPSRVPVTLTHIQVSRFSPDKPILNRAISSPQMLYQFDDQSSDENPGEESAATLKGQGRLASNPSSLHLQVPTSSKRALETRPGFFNPPAPGHPELLPEDQPPSPGKSRHMNSLSLRTAGGAEQDMRHSNPLTFQGMASETHNHPRSESRPSFGSEHILPHSHAHDSLDGEQAH